MLIELAVGLGATDNDVVIMESDRLLTCSLNRSQSDGVESS
jgi:hypothetical protein